MCEGSEGLGLVQFNNFTGRKPLHYYTLLYTLLWNVCGPLYCCLSVYLDSFN